MRKRKIEVEVETEKIVLRGRAPSISWCRECGRHTAWVNAEQAATLAGVGEMMIYRMVELGRLHHVETTGGRLRICLRSLSAIEQSSIVRDTIS